MTVVWLPGRRAGLEFVEILLTKTRRIGYGSVDAGRKKSLYHFKAGPAARQPAPPEGIAYRPNPPAQERLGSGSAPALTQLASSCARNRTTRIGVPVASHPDNALDRLCSRAALYRSPSRNARPLEEHGRTHDELHLGPVGWRPHRRDSAGFAAKVGRDRGVRIVHVEERRPAERADLGPGDLWSPRLASRWSTRRPRRVGWSVRLSTSRCPHDVMQRRHGRRHRTAGRTA